MEVTDPFLLGSPRPAHGLQDQPNPRNPVLEQLLLSSFTKPGFYRAGGGEDPELKNSEGGSASRKEVRSKRGIGEKEGLYTLTLEAAAKGWQGLPSAEHCTGPRLLPQRPYSEPKGLYLRDPYPSSSPTFPRLPFRWASSC